MTDFRSNEKAAILGCLKNSISTFVCGSQGIGKTTLIREVAKEVNDRFGQAVYVDCSLYFTANAVLREILITLGSVIASKSNYELTKRLKEKARKVKLIVFLDHFDNLKKHDIISILLGLDFCICPIADSTESHRALSFDLRARLANIVKISRLPDDQIFEIVAEKAGVKSSNDVIHTVVEKSTGNLTLALNMLRGIETNVKNVDLEELDFYTDTPSLGEDHSIILSILNEHKRLPSGELYSRYCQKSEFSKSERSFRNFMQTLCRQGLVKSIGDKRGRCYQLVEPKEVLNG